MTPLRSDVKHDSRVPLIPLFPTLKEVIRGRLHETLESMTAPIHRLSCQFPPHTAIPNHQDPGIGRRPLFHLAPVHELV